MELNITVYEKKDDEIIDVKLICKPSVGEEIISPKGTYIVIEVLHFSSKHSHSISVWCKRAKKQR